MIVKPRCSYSLHIVHIFCVMVCNCLLSRASTVPNLMSLEIVTRNGILFMNIISIHNVTFPCIFSKSGGTSSIYVDTCGLGWWTVLSLSQPRLGPNMSSAARTSCRVIGQLVKCLIDTPLLIGMCGLCHCHRPHYRKTCCLNTRQKDAKIKL